MSIYNTHFYHGLLKKYTTVLGALLDGIDVVRFKADGSEESRTRVPLSYANKEKWVRRIIEDTTMTDRQPAITLPRMSFEMSSIQYAPERKLSSKRYYAFPIQSNTTHKYKVMQPVPYDIIYNVHAIAKTQEDMLQIIEQIAPFFTPDYTVEIRGITNPEIKFDIPISLMGFEPDDNAQGGFEDRRMIIWNIQFLLKGYLFGPIKERSVIKEIDIHIYDMDELQMPQILRNYMVDIGVVPFIEGVPLEDIGPDDPYEIQVTVDYNQGI